MEKKLKVWQCQVTKGEGQWELTSSAGAGVGAWRRGCNWYNHFGECWCHMWLEMYLPPTQRNCTCASGDVHRNVSYFIVCTCPGSEEWVKVISLHNEVSSYSEWRKAVCIGMNKSQKCNAQHKKFQNDTFILYCLYIKFRPIVHCVY